VALDLHLLGSKVRRYREQFEVSVDEVASATGLDAGQLGEVEEGKREPTGDEILILADYFKCDYKFFISNETTAPFDQTETLFRRYGDKLDREDRWAVQEFLFLCDCEQYLHEVLEVRPNPFSFTKRGTMFKVHGADAAAKLRAHLGMRTGAVPSNIFETFRRLGIHVFRRQLRNRDLSGLYIRHPTAGQCVLVNYEEDLFRQRFTVAHEAGHAILDAEADLVVSGRWDKGTLVEIRANVFATEFLIPADAVPPLASELWDIEKVREIAGRLHVNVKTLAWRLEALGRIGEQQARDVARATIPRGTKADEELAGLSPTVAARKRVILERGLSDYYAGLVLRAHDLGKISFGRVAEMLLSTEKDAIEVARLFMPSWSPRHA
jgi:Zn-dependent peptidase ImmA (M78 family)